MNRLIKKQIKTSTNNLKENLADNLKENLEELLRLELSQVAIFKFAEITLTGIYHDAYVPNFANFFEEDAEHAWEIAMILSCYHIQPKMQNLKTLLFSTIQEFLPLAIELKKEVLNQYTLVRDLFNKPDNENYDSSVVTILEEIMTEERLHLCELVKLAS